MGTFNQLASVDNDAWDPRLAIQMLLKDELRL
jgi:hypothetical protein